MREIIELNGRLRQEPADQLPKDGVMLERGDVRDELARLPRHLRDDAMGLCDALNRAIPDDFGYVLFLGDTEPDLLIGYDNGSTTSAGRGHEWNAAASIFDQLRALDWDEERKWAIQGSETFDAIIAAAKEMPAMVPRTKTLQKRFSDAVKTYIKEKRADRSCVHVLLWDGEESLLDHDFDHVKAFERKLPDLMTLMHHVLTVVVDGKPFSAEKIDRMNTAALKDLEDMPISHAKASGKFLHIMAQGGGGER